MTTADERDRACEQFLTMRAGYLVLVDKGEPRLWCLRDADGVALLVADCVSLTMLAHDHRLPIMTVH